VISHHRPVVRRPGCLFPLLSLIPGFSQAQSECSTAVSGGLGCDPGPSGAALAGSHLGRPGLPGPSGRRPRPGGGPAGVPPPTVGNLAALVPGSQSGSDSESALGSGPTGMPLRRCERFAAAAPGAIRVLRDPLNFRVVSAYASPSPCFRFCSLFFSALLGLRLPLELEPT
jgi:hypothetical protein